MPSRFLTLALAFLVLSAPAEAGTTWLGAQLQFPVPAGDIGNTQLGVDAGLTLTQMQSAHFGVGADLIYHYWPTSPGYVAAFDRYLRTERMEALQGSDWAFSALQFTGHIKLVPPVARRRVPWVQVGAGAYGLDLNLDEQRPPGTYAWVSGPGLSNFKIVPGGYGEVGVDLHVSSPVVLGVNATFQYVWSRQTSAWGWGGINDMQDFSAFTVGVHALFGPGDQGNMER